MDVDHLILLRELAARGTVAAVASAQHRTASAVSQQLKVAERAFGVRLTEPDGRRLRLTPAGRLLAEGASEVTAAVARVQAQLDALQGSPTGVVTLAALPSAAAWLLAPTFSRLAATRIEVAFADHDVSEEEFGRLAAEYDLVVGHTMAERTPSVQSGLLVTTLAREPLDVALPAGHRLCGQAVVRPPDLVGMPWIGVPTGFPFDTLRLAIEQAGGFRFEVVQRLRDNDVVASLVAAGFGAALLPRFTTRPRPGLVTRPLAGVRSSRRIVAIARPDKAERAAVRVVLQALLDAGRAASEENRPA